MPLSFFLAIQDGVFSLVEKRKGERMAEKVGIQREVYAQLCSLGKSPLCFSTGEP